VVVRVDVGAQEVGGERIRRHIRRRLRRDEPVRRGHPAQRVDHFQVVRSGADLKLRPVPPVAAAEQRQPGEENGSESPEGHLQLQVRVAIVGFMGDA
jgi:hypothetical protein